MSISEILETVEKIPSRPGRSKIDVPPGYDSFYTKPAGPTTSHIMGITPNGKHVQISTTTKDLAKVLAQAYNAGGISQSNVQQVSFIDVFGSEIEREFNQIGINFAEKPDNWDWIKTNYSCSESQCNAVLNNISPIASLDAASVFKDNIGTHPMEYIKPGLPDSCIVTFPNGDRFITAKGGSKSYYRMWLHICPKN